MVDLPNDVIGIDTGQLRNVKKKDESNNQGTTLEILKTGKKQVNTADMKGQKKNNDEEMIVEEENHQTDKSDEQSACANQFYLNDNEKM